MADKAHQVKESVQGEFDKMQPRTSEDQAWTQGRIVSNTPEVEQRPSFDGSRRRIVTESVDPSEVTVSTPVCGVTVSGGTLLLSSLFPVACPNEIQCTSSDVFDTNPLPLAYPPFFPSTIISVAFWMLHETPGVTLMKHCCLMYEWNIVCQVQVEL